ncbi:MAG: MlaD family protein [Bradymonadaceae bacterium]
MATRAQKIQLGFFFIVVAIVFAGAFIALTGAQFWENRGMYVVRYQHSVSGLELGAAVKLQGVRVGSVNKIQINPDNMEEVEVYMQVQAKTPIKTDTEAVVMTTGITGLKYIELMESTAEADLLPPGSEVKPGQSMFDQLSGKATDMSVQVALILENVLHMTGPENQDRLDSILVQADEFMSNSNTLSRALAGLSTIVEEILIENREPIKNLFDGLDETIRDFRRLLVSLDQTVTTINVVVGTLELPETMLELRATNMMVQERLTEIDLPQAVDDISLALGTLQALLENLSQMVNANHDQLRATMYNVRQASESLKELSRTLQQRPSRLIFDEKAEERTLP